MVADKTWEGKVPANTSIAYMLVSKSMWHSHYQATFDRVHAFPELVQWLDQDEDALAADELFGYTKTTYTFKDVQGYMNRAEAGSSSGKIKRKTREDDPGSPKKQDGGHKKGKKVDRRKQREM
jgi:hypothetical protein